MSVLVVTATDDTTADRVCAALDGRGAGHIRFDLADFPVHASFSASTGTGSPWTGRLALDGRTVDVDDITAVYYRKPGAFRFPDSLSDQARQFARREARHGLGGFLLSLPVRWVSHPSLIADAENKPAQLRVADTVGLSIPETLITNDVGSAREFAARVGRVVYKPLSAPFVRAGDTVKLVYTSLVSADLFDATQIGFTVAQFQQWVPKKFEVRATAVGDRVFAAAIHAGSDAGYVDWRSDYANLRYEVVEVPDEVTRAVVGYLDRFGLAFGAFDFVVDLDGRWWFLECNPNGQWGWIEEETGLPIAAAIADALTGAAA